MRWLPLLAPLALVVADLNPIQVVPDSTGGFRVSLGGSFGQYEGRELGCSNEVLDSWSVPQRAISGEFEARPSSSSRVSIWVALDGPDLNLTTYGAQLAGEWMYGGVGIGVARTLSQEYADYPYDSRYSWWAPYETLPSIYLRAGREDQVHFRVDVAPPSVYGSAAGRARMGLASNQGWNAGTRFQGGISMSTTADGAYMVGVYADAAVPVTRGWEFRLMGTIKPSAGNMDGNIGFGLRRSFGAPPARRHPPASVVVEPDSTHPGPAQPDSTKQDVRKSKEKKKSGKKPDRSIF